MPRRLRTWCRSPARLGGPGRLLKRPKGFGIGGGFGSPPGLLRVRHQGRSELPSEESKPSTHFQRTGRLACTGHSATLVRKMQEVSPQEFRVNSTDRAVCARNGASVVVTDLEIREDRDPPTRIGRADAEVDVLAVETVAEVERTDLFPHRPANDHRGTGHPVDCASERA